MSRRHPIFFDPFGRRARITTFILILLIILTLAGLVAGAAGILVPPSLRGVLESDAAEVIETVAPVFRSAGQGQVQINPMRHRHLPPNAASVLRLAFMPTVPGAVASLQRNAGSLDGVIPQWLALSEADGLVRVSVSQHADPITQWIRSNAPHLVIMPTLTTHLSSTGTARALAHPETRARLVSNILELVTRHDFDGLVLDLHDLSLSSNRPLAALLQELGVPLRNQGRSLILSTRLDGGWRDVQSVVPLVDSILVQAHAQNPAETDPGPPASQGWFESQIATALSALPRHKVIVSVGAYAFDPAQPGDQRIIPMQRGWDIARTWDSEIVFDRATLNSHASLPQAHGQRRYLWMLDAATGFNQIRAAMAENVSGVALWQLGYEDPGVWAWLSRGKVPEAAALGEVEVVETGPGGLQFAQGALLNVAGGTNGTRALTLDRELGLVIDQALEVLPGEHHARRFPPIDPKAVALTFDDGPDPRYTPQILDILAEKGVKATFYVLGRNALAAPEIMNRIYSEEHDIGNHSYTHANLSLAGWLRTTFELNATQRVIEMQLGIRTKLFRAPYSEPDYYDLEAAPYLLKFLSLNGYLVGGWNVDSLDYRSNAEHIHRRVVDDVLNGKGQVVLLHDSGGSRDETIQALPWIIDDLHEAGYRFVTTHELVGLARKDLMPLQALGQYREAVENWLREAGIAISAWFIGTFPMIAIGAACLSILRLLAIVVAVFTRRDRLWEDRLPENRQPCDASVTVLVPAFNEEKVIAMTVRSLLDATIADEIEIVVIDDGSTDRTSAVVEEEFAGDRRVRVLCKPNGGKAAALNFGLTQIDAEIVVAIDGDTLLERDAIERLVAPFGDPSVGAVAGKVVVGNRVNLLTRFQALEYAVSQNLDRRAFERFNAIGVVPGAIGAWRRRAVLDAGGYASETLAEDADLTLTLQRRGWRIVSVPDAIALTEAPETLRPLLKQRFRWTFGMLQVAWKHLPALLRPPTGVSMVTIPNILVFQFTFTLLAPLMDLLLLVTVVLAGIALVSGADAAPGMSLAILAMYWLMFQTIDVSASAAGVMVDRDRTLWRLVPLVIVQRFTYRQILYWVTLRALLAAIKGTFVGWGKLVRTGTVTVRPLTQG
jgi:peptidoglycan-N-acetylglucosamine deacetylase